MLKKASFLVFLAKKADKVSIFAPNQLNLLNIRLKIPIQIFLIFWNKMLTFAYYGAIMQCVYSHANILFILRRKLCKSNFHVS